MKRGMGRRAILAEEGWYAAKRSLSWWGVSRTTMPGSGASCTYLLLGQVIGQVGDHDLGLGRNTVGRRATLPALTRRAGLRLPSLTILILVSLGFVGDILQSINLICGLSFSSIASVLGGGTLLLLLILISC